jgi:hypothetical protein
MSHLHAGTILLIGTMLPLAVPAIAAKPQNIQSYDHTLCAMAQCLLVNAADGDFAIEILRGKSNGFHTIQMDASAASHTVTVAAATEVVDVDGGEMVTSVACKMVDRQRINEVLGLNLPGPERSCSDVNQHTYQAALATLSAAERNRYVADGRQLRFGADSMAVSGGEWLPSRIDDYITSGADAVASESYLLVTAPSVRVPWKSQSGEFYQGTQHCKLISLAAMQRWMRSGAFAKKNELFPRTDVACIAPASMTSESGSCLFWFAPAQAMFCQDYSGAGWDATAAQAECAKRHASAEALTLAGNKYAGAGGRYSSNSCVKRADSEPVTGTCVFHCNAPDETLWHTLTAMDNSAGAGKLMSRACDLFIPAR